MRFLGGLTTLFYTLLFLLIGCMLLAVGLGIRGIIDLSLYIEYFKSLNNLWLIVSSIGVVFIILGFSIIKIAIGRFQREKTIAFTNPEGEVTISLGAIEDFIKKAAIAIAEVKEIRSDVVAGKKGIDITTRVTLWSDINIPETAQKIQDIIKSRVQNILGIEEAITVKVHVAKIVQKDEKKKKDEESPMRVREAM